ncbi:MAG: AMP-binding protein [Parasporobacterium sp.]|nr:AMP-binding protein [Parasporobacterium sp.]
MIQFLELFRKQLSDTPEKAAVIYSRDASSLTYSRIDEISSRLHGYLKQKGIGKEDQVLLLLPRGVMIPACMIGVWKNGSSVIICESTMAPERVRYILSDSSAKIVITEKELEEILDAEPLYDAEEVDSHDCAFVVYTSGTTGNPKGVIHEYGNLDEILAANQYQGEKFCLKEDVLAYNAPMNFVAMMDFSIDILSNGGTLLIMDPDDVKNTEKLIGIYSSYEVTCTFMTPSLFRSITKLNDQMRWIILGGEACVNLYHEKTQLFNGYNMSESGKKLLLYKIEKPLEKTPVGKNQAGESILILDENGNPVPDGELGELAFVNDYVRGYINLPEKTAQAWHDGLYFTGDLGRKLPDGNIILEGRNDDMIKINGNRIEPAEIEAVSKQELGLSWAVAKGFVTEERSFIVLYYNDDVELDPEESRAKLAEKLTAYMLPSYFVRLSEIPLLPNGKLDKKSLKAPDLNCYRAAYAAPENDLERKLLAAFEKVLGQEHLGVNDDFYDLGGDSLRAIRLITDIQDPSLNVPLLYKNRTVRAVALAMQQDTINEGKSIEHRDGNAREHDQPLTAMQYHLLDNQLYKPKSTFNNMPLFWRMPKDKVDEQRLINGFKTLIRNHPALQSTIRIDEEMMYAFHFDPDLMPDLKFEDVTEEEIESLKQELIQPFKLINAPLFRFRFFRSAEFIYVFIDFHHIFSDGTSIQIIYQNISDAYHGKELAHDNSYLYLRDVQKHQLNGDYERAHAWNVAKYGNVDWCRNITPDMKSRSNHASSISCPFPLSRKELDAYCEKNQMTLNSLALSACLLAIHEVEHKNDIMVSWLFHGRDQTAYQYCVAPLIRELPVAVSFDGISSLEELLNEVKEQAAEGIRNADYPYIVKTTSVAVNDSFRIRNQGVMRNFNGIQGVPFELIELTNKESAASLMNIQLLEAADGEYSLCLTYGDQRYKKETAEKVLSRIVDSFRLIAVDG